MQSECISRAMVFQKFPDTRLSIDVPSLSSPSLPFVLARRSRSLQNASGIFARSGRSGRNTIPPVFRMERLESGDNNRQFVSYTGHRTDYRTPFRSDARQRLNSSLGPGAMRKPVKFVVREIIASLYMR